MYLLPKSKSGRITIGLVCILFAGLIMAAGYGFAQTRHHDSNHGLNQAVPKPCHKVTYNWGGSVLCGCKNYRPNFFGTCACGHPGSDHW